MCQLQMFNWQQNRLAQGFFQDFPRVGGGGGGGANQHS